MGLECSNFILVQRYTYNYNQLSVMMSHGSVISTEENGEGTAHELRGNTTEAGSLRAPPVVGEPVIGEDSPSAVVYVYHCWICSEEFLDKLSIIQHLKKLHAGRPELRGIETRMRVPICLMCGVSGGCEHRRKKNRSSRSNNNDDSESSGDDGSHDDSHPWSCAICDHRFKSFTALRKHRMKKHPGEKSYQCSFCPSAFINQSHLASHTRIHTGLRPHVCSLCGSRFARRSDLHRHNRTHTGEKPFKCEQCDTFFTQKASLEKHARVHAKRSGCFACEQCGLIFKTTIELTTHMKSKHKDKVWQCQTCGKAFSAQGYLLLHQKSHNLTKQFPCSYCGKKFAFRALLSKHEDRVHRYRQDIKCDECGRSFKWRENLTRHKRTHTGVKQFKCPVCGLGFTEQGSVKRHMMSQHEYVRPHGCTACCKAFSRKFLLTKHIARYHPELKATKSETKNLAINAAVGFEGSLSGEAGAQLDSLS